MLNFNFLVLFYFGQGGSIFWFCLCTKNSFTLNIKRYEIYVCNGHRE